MEPFPNDFKGRLLTGDTLIGLWLGLSSPYTAELCACSGFDWLLVDAEHSPNDVPRVLSQLQAIAPYRSVPIVRPPVGDTVLIKRYLDIGVQTLLIPMVESAAQAAALVGATRYPPTGMRGVGAGLARASRWGRVPSYLTNAADEICLLLQIETVAGLAALEEIAAVPGVDGIFVGPSDLAASLGHIGESNHPEVRKVVAEAAITLRRLGKPAGILTTDETYARQCIEDGYRFVAIGTDVALLAHAADELLGRVKSTLHVQCSASAS